MGDAGLGFSGFRMLGDGGRGSPGFLAFGNADPPFSFFDMFACARAFSRSSLSFSLLSRASRISRSRASRSLCFALSFSSSSRFFLSSSALFLISSILFRPSSFFRVSSLAFSQELLAVPESAFPLPSTGLAVVACCHDGLGGARASGPGTARCQLGFGGALDSGPGEGSAGCWARGWGLDLG